MPKPSSAQSSGSFIVRTVSPISRTGRSTAIGFRFAFFELAAQYHRAPEMPSHNAAADGFLPTRWSLVIKTRGDGDDARSALETLCSAYWFPLYSWSRRYGASPEDAEDFVQGFFVQILSRKLFASADPNLGRLRTFLITAFRRHVRDEKTKLSRGKRGGGNVISFNAADAESWYIAEQRDGESPDSMFDRQWALTVLERAIARLEAHARGVGLPHDARQHGARVLHREVPVALAREVRDLADHAEAPAHPILERARDEVAELADGEVLRRVGGGRRLARLGRRLLPRHRRRIKETAGERVAAGARGIERLPCHGVV